MLIGGIGHGALSKGATSEFASFPVLRLGMYSERLCLWSSHWRRSLPEWVKSLEALNQSGQGLYFNLVPFGIGQNSYFNLKGSTHCFIQFIKIRMLKKLFSFSDRYRILHQTWFAFFLTFVCWFNFAPFATTIGKELHLGPEQIKTLGICNLALTIPARLIIGMLLDRFGPRITYSMLLMFAVVPCLATALAQDFNQLVISRLLMGIVGSGFVVGIRMVAEWFQPKEMGIAQGIYGGWGNFGAFGAEFALPMLAVSTSFFAGGASNWRFAIALTGIIAAIYGVIYYNSVQDTPTGKVYKKPQKNGSLEVTSIKSFWAMIVSNFGLIFALGLLAWRLEQKNIHFLTLSQMYFTWLLLAGLFAYQSYKAWVVNRELLIGKKTYAPSERFKFGQVALLEFTYITSFGSELAVVSMLPAFFEKTFALEHVVAGMIAATYPFLNLISRPSGGLISDKFSSRKWTMTMISAGIGVAYLMSLLWCWLWFRSFTSSPTWQSN